jgi:hypothetical protein
MSNLAARKPAHLNSRLIGRALAAIILASPLAGCFEMATWSTGAPGAVAAPDPAAARPPCPSQDFAVFLDAFGESVEIQRGYTRIPLMYGQLNAALLGTPREAEAMNTRTINSFDTIPISDSKEGGRILRSKAKRRGLRVKVEPDREDAPNTKTVSVVLPHTGFHLEYQFASTDTCWELVRIDDRSTTATPRRAAEAKP